MTTLTEAALELELEEEGVATSRGDYYTKGEWNDVRRLIAKLDHDVE